MRLIDEVVLNDGSRAYLYMQGQTIMAYGHPDATRAMQPDQLGYITWSQIPYIQVNERRGTDLAVLLVGAALRGNPDFPDTDDKTCDGAHLAIQVNLRYGTSFSEVPRPDRMGGCKRGNACMFDHQVDGRG